MATAAPQGPSFLDRLIAGSASTALLLVRFLLALFFIWLGLTKCVPGWNPLDTEVQTMLTAMTQGKVDGSVLIYVIGGAQILAGLLLLVPGTLRFAVILLGLLLATYIAMAVFHLPDLHDGKGLPTLFATIVLRNALLTLAAIAVAARAVKDRLAPVA